MKLRVFRSKPAARPPPGTFEALPRRIFLDSCTAQTLRDYDGYVYEGESIPEFDLVTE